MPVPTQPPACSADTIWDDFIQWEKSEFPRGDDSLPMDPTVPLFRQSILAFNVGSWELAAMGCRATVEAIGYTFMARRPIALASWAGSVPRDREGRPRRVEYAEVKKFLLARVTLKSDLVDALDRIQFAGDATAHVAARLEEEVDTLTNKRRRRAGAPKDPLQLWIRQEDVRKNIEDTGLIIRQVLLAAKVERDHAMPSRTP
jgi:hypothetical protein